MACTRFRRSQEVFVDPALAVLHQCIRSQIGARCTHDISKAETAGKLAYADTDRIWGDGCRARKDSQIIRKG